MTLIQSMGFYSYAQYWQYLKNQNKTQTKKPTAAKLKITKPHNSNKTKAR